MSIEIIGIVHYSSQPISLGRLAIMRLVLIMTRNVYYTEAHENLSQEKSTILLYPRIIRIIPYNLYGPYILHA